MNVLFLTPWYPNRYDAMEGLFVQKHAEAVSLYADVKVLYVYADKNIHHFEINITKYKDIEEYRIYYPFSNSSIWGRIKKTFFFLKAHQKGLKTIRQTGWNPDILHTNILTRTPFIGLIYKIRYGTPYVITEHWTRLLKTQNQFNGTLRKILAKMVVKNAAYLLPVSKELLEGLKFNHLLNTKYKVIENVVDKCFYESYPAKSKEKKQIVNVTCFLEKAKNLFGLLRAIKVISDQRNDFELILVGKGVDFEKTYDYYKTLNFPEGIVHFAGEKTSKEVAGIMHNSDFVVQFSNYESAGVVVEEALVSGKPVISTKVGIAPDYINNSNGLLVDVRDEKQLAEAINYLLDNINQYNNDEIRKSNAEFFSYEYIGRKFYNIYKDILQK